MFIPEFKAASWPAASSPFFPPLPRLPPCSLCKPCLRTGTVKPSAFFRAYDIAATTVCPGRSASLAAFLRVMAKTASGSKSTLLNGS